MLRRNFILKPVALGLGAAIIGQMRSVNAQTATTCTPLTSSTLPLAVGPGINVVDAVKALRIPTGPYAGAYEIAPNGLSNWYFSNLGLISIVQFLNAADLDTYIRSYLDLYLSKLEPNLSIQDVHFPFGRANPQVFTRVLADSDDSYAATLLTLATRYVRASQNWTWWNQNKVRLKDITYRNILLSIKSNGLTSVFQAPRNQANNAGYLMDNCEVYRGLRDFSEMLRDRGDNTDAAYYSSFADGIARAMSTLFMPATSAFKMADLSTQSDTSFYPGTSCQVFPQVFGVSELAGYYDRAWNFFNTNTVGWATGTLDPYPWAVLGLAAAKRGQTALAQAQLASIEQTFKTRRQIVTINELGFYQRTKSVLAGRADV